MIIKSIIISYTQEDWKFFILKVVKCGELTMQLKNSFRLIALTIGVLCFLDQEIIAFRGKGIMLQGVDFGMKGVARKGPLQNSKRFYTSDEWHKATGYFNHLSQINEKPPMEIKICVAGATGWTGSLLTKHLLKSSSQELSLVAAIARSKAGEDIGEVLGLKTSGIKIAKTLEEAFQSTPDVLIDFTNPHSVKERVMSSLDKNIHVVIGTSGMSAEDYIQIDEVARQKNLGVIAAGNFSITAALASHFALIAAKHLPSWEIIDYAHADKIDAPSGTTRELAERLAEVKQNTLALSIDSIYGSKEARGASIGHTQVHSIRLPSYVIAFETIFGLPDERLTIRHDAGAGAEPYVAGTLLAAKKVINVRGLIRGLDKILF